MGCQRLCPVDQDLCNECAAEFERAYAQGAGQSVDRQADGEPVAQVAVPESAHAAKRAACEEQREGLRNAIRQASDEDGAESARQAHAAAYSKDWAAVLVTDAALEAGIHQLQISLDLSRDLLADMLDDGNLHATAAAVYRAMVLASRDSDGTPTGAINEDLSVPQDCQARAESIAQGLREIPHTPQTPPSNKGC